MAEESGPTGTSLLSTFVLILAAMAVLFAADTFLVKLQQAEDRAEATRLYGKGRDMMAAGHYSEAAAQFKDAVSVDRQNREYRMALAGALLAAKDFSEAEQTLTTLLQEDSTDGDANLMMARLLAAEDQPAQAISYYHRAIYGRWTTNPAQNQLRVRFELVDLLAKQHTKEELLAELLPLQEEAPKDLATRKRIGQLFLSAGSPARAADVFRQLLHDDPQDADIYAGLGEAEFGRGNYQTAHADFLEAAQLKPDDSAIRARVELCEQILALDPTRRGLSPGDRYQRSLRLVGLALDQVNRCAPPADPAGQQQRDAADKVLKTKLPASRQSAAIESNLDLAEQLWTAHGRQCSSTPPASEDALSLVLAKIAQ
jgi:tetratricopeptide (TPR) repeat protein